MYTPLNYNQITWMEGRISPSSVKPYNNWSYEFWERSLYNRLISVIEFSLPDNWQGSISDFFHWCLYRYGFVMISRDEEHGYFFQPAAPKGFTFYYQPAEMVCSNPLLTKTGQKSKSYVIGEECEVLKLTPDYRGLFDIIDRYAVQLSTLDTAINTNIINSKLAYLVTAKNRAEAEALKTIMDRINSGEPSVFYEKYLSNKKPNDDSEPFNITHIQDVAKNYIVSNQLQDLQTILNSFDLEVGIPTIPYQKAERMNTYEASSRQQDTKSKLSTMCACLDASLKDIKELYPDLQLSYKIREEELDNGSGETDNNRNAELYEE